VVIIISCPAQDLPEFSGRLSTTAPEWVIGWPVIRGPFRIFPIHIARWRLLLLAYLLIWIFRGMSLGSSFRILKDKAMFLIEICFLAKKPREKNKKLE